MNDFLSLAKYEVFNLLRAKWLLAYGLFFGGFAFAILQYGGEPEKTVASLMSITLLVVPMTSVFYATFYWYSTETFTALLLTQPLRRSSVYLARWAALSGGLAGTYLAGSFLGIAAQGAMSAGAFLLLTLGAALTFIFVSLGMLIAVLVSDRMKGIGLALTAWLYVSVLHDALVFFAISAFQEYPVEIPGMLLMALNPVDLARVTLLMSLEYGAMMGYTGRILQKALSSAMGVSLTSLALLLWVLVPVAFGVKAFRGKDL